MLMLSTLLGGLAASMYAGAELSIGASIPVPSDIQEAVFHKELSAASNKYAYCLGVDGHDPGPVILKAVQREGISIVGASDCVAASDTLRGSYLKSNHQQAMFILIGPYRRIDNSGGTLKLKTYQGGLDASGGTLLLSKTPEGWVAKSIGYQWES